MPLSIGPIAALLTPRDSRGEIDQGAFVRNVESVMTAGAAGVCINGATGECPAGRLIERDELVGVTREALKGRGRLIAGIGSPDIAHCLTLGRKALDAGADLLLLMPPYFFRYEQCDIESFYREAARELDGPILIYNLPVFTNPVETDTALRLIESVPNIVGIKDSSGSLATLEALTQRGLPDVIRIVGHDGVLAEALRRGLCDGVISGVAGVLPELIIALFESRESGDEARFGDGASRLAEFVEQLGALPVPWGLKVVAEARGSHDARFAVPVCDRRRKEQEHLRRWFAPWWEACEQTLLSTAAPSSRG